MSQKVDLFDSTYSHFEAEVLARIRQKTFGEDFGQNSWTTAAEYREWAKWLALDTGSSEVEQQRDSARLGGRDRSAAPAGRALVRSGRLKGATTRPGPTARWRDGG